MFEKILPNSKFFGKIKNMKNSCLIAILVDSSGSMGSMYNEVISGLNNFIKKQKELPGECLVQVTQFDDIVEEVFSIRDIKDLPEFVQGKHFQPRGLTALNQAMGETINKIGKYLDGLDKPNRVIICQISDGGENASKEYTLERVREMIEHQKTKYNWEFIFLGANMDAQQVGGAMGVNSKSAITYSANAKGMIGALNSLTNYTTSYRCANTAEEAANVAFSEEDREAAK
jgi:hypothetical protein